MEGIKGCLFSSISEFPPSLLLIKTRTICSIFKLRLLYPRHFKHKHQTEESLVRLYIHRLYFTFASCHLLSQTHCLLFCYLTITTAPPIITSVSSLHTNHKNGHLPIRNRRPNHHVEEVGTRLLLRSRLSPIRCLAAEIGRASCRERVF